MEIRHGIQGVKESNESTTALTITPLETTKNKNLNIKEGEKIIKKKRENKKKEAKKETRKHIHIHPHILTPIPPTHNLPITSRLITTTNFHEPSQPSPGHPTRYPPPPPPPPPSEPSSCLHYSYRHSSLQLRIPPLTKEVKEGEVSLSSFKCIY
ncbi:hypothetical protein E2C01_075996 [Portunus trituberculatus]|uniref:Uncharacterized protein n=1 Tax=Portunus trituberculatus TaxID=210409 RepID=A0A5B7IGC7_PORTR|nr:hypothetical protein [Portunus trituberculatus]